MKKTMVTVGRYRHYKSNNVYEVIGFALHTETLEEMVIYKALYDSAKFGNGCVWVRPKAMFEEEVDHHSQRVPRFQRIEPTE